MTAQKVVLSVGLHDDHRCKKKVMKMASSVHGIDSITVDVKANKLTLIGTMDPIELVTKLRKAYHTEVVSIGPAKEPEKPKEKPKEEPKTQFQVIEHFKPYEYIYPPHHLAYYYDPFAY